MKIIATDLDRTLLYNGSQTYDNSMGLFKTLVKKNHVKLIFVTGRPLYLIKDAMKRYSLPSPTYCVSALGTKIYEYKEGTFKELVEWSEYIKTKNPKFDSQKISTVLAKIKKIKRQTTRYLNEFKESYNLSTAHTKDAEKIIKKIKAALKKLKTRFKVIYSIDKNRNMGLIDILPKHVSKKEALDFLERKLKIKKSNLIYAGDSGNDLDIFLGGYHGVVVNNASSEIKKKIQNRKGIYIARGVRKGLNGNYVSGIIEGAYHFGIFK